MSYAPIAHTIPEYDRTLYANWWLKAYEQGTTTPLPMATDAAAGTTLAKAKLDAQGFPITSGSVRFIPFIDGYYDLFLFPTEEEADANITVNAIQFADNLNADPFSSGVDKYYDTLDLAVADIASISIGDVIILKERTSGNGGGARWDAVDATTVTENGFDIVTGNANVSLQLMIGDVIDYLQIGGNPDGITLNDAVNSVALANGKYIYLPEGTFLLTAIPVLDKYYGIGRLKVGSVEYVVPFTFPHLHVNRGTPVDIITKPSELGAMTIHNHEDSEGAALDILNAGDRAAGNSAANAVTIHHYSDGIPQQIDNVGVNTSLVIKQARNATRRSDKASDYVGDGPFIAFTRASDGSADDHTGVAQNVARFNANGDLQFDPDTKHRNSARSIHAVGAVAVTDEVIDTGDGSTVTFSGTLALTTIETSTLSITDGTETFTETGTTVLTGDAGGSGTIVYSTGEWSVTFNTAPTNLQDITADYQYGQSLRISTATGNLFLQANQVGRVEHYVIYPQNPVRMVAVIVADAAIANPGESNPSIARDSVTGAQVYWTGTKYIRLSVISGATGDRPASPDIDDAHYLDTDLGIPIWYDGSNWIDATGSTV